MWWVNDCNAHANPSLHCFISTPDKIYSYHFDCILIGEWTLGEIACDIWTTFNIWFGCSSLLNLCVVSWDRYVAVTSPLIYTMRMRDYKVRIFIGLVWSISLLLSILYTLGFKFSPKRYLCAAVGLPMYFTVLAFVFPIFSPNLFCHIRQLRGLQGRSQSKATNR